MVLPAMSLPSKTTSPFLLLSIAGRIPALVSDAVMDPVPALQVIALSSYPIIG